MKKIFILALLGLASVNAKAQNYSVTNGESCDITFTAVCIDPASCGIVSTGSSATITAGGTGSITAIHCSGSNVQAWQACWSAPGCSATCTTFPLNPGTAPASCYPGPLIHGFLPVCGTCSHGGNPAEILSDPTRLVIDAH